MIVQKSYVLLLLNFEHLPQIGQNIGHKCSFLLEELLLVGFAANDVSFPNYIIVASTETSSVIISPSFKSCSLMSVKLVRGF